MVGGGGAGPCKALTFDGEYLYAGCAGASLQVIKLSPGDMAPVGTWDGGGGGGDFIALTCDGEYIYAGLDTIPAQVVQIDPSDMSTVETWEGEEGEGLCRALTFDGFYVYAGLYTTPARVVRAYLVLQGADSRGVTGVTEDYGFDLALCGQYTHNRHIGIYLLAWLGTHPGNLAFSV